MILGIIALIIGVLVLAVGIYSLKQEKDDPESRKIYTIAAVIGAAVALVGVIRLVLTLL